MTHTHTNTTELPKLNSDSRMPGDRYSVFPFWQQMSDLLMSGASIRSHRPLLACALLLLATRAEAYPERIDELLHNGQHAAPSSFAAAISMMATEDLLAQPAQQQQQAPRHQVRHGEPVHFVQSLEEREQEQPLAQPATATATAVDAPSSGFHLLAGRVAKRTVVALSDSVESFSTGGIPAIWVAIMMVTAVVALFLCCWCMAYCMCMYGTERDAVRAAKSRKPHKRDRMS